MDNNNNKNSHIINITMSTTRTTTRRPSSLKWRPPPPPTPRILHFPRRLRRKQPDLRRPHKTKKLEALFDEERSFSRDNPVPIVLLNSGGCGRRERVVEEEEEILERESGGNDVVKERERDRGVVEVEVLRAECKFLRMEREMALKKLERNRVRMERTLRSAVQTLLFGRKKICEGKNPNLILEEEIADLAEKLMKLQRSSEFKGFEVRSCSNFDKQASLLQRRLEKLGGISDEKCLKEIRAMAESSLSMNVNDESVALNHNSKFTDMEVLRRKMEGLSNGTLLEKMEEEYGSMLSTANNSVASSASNSRRIEFPDSCSTSLRQPNQETMLREENPCSGRCKAIVRRIVEQVRAETEQWSQMQEMLGQVREEMEELQASRDFWEEQALDSDVHIQSLYSAVQEWKQKALTSEAKANELQEQIYVLQSELERTRMDHQNTQVSRAKSLLPIPPDAQNEKEKRVLICRLKENGQNSSSGKKPDMFNDGRKGHTNSSRVVALRRSPFRDIGNSSSSPLVRQISKAICTLHSREQSNVSS